MQQKQKVIWCFLPLVQSKLRPPTGQLRSPCHFPLKTVPKDPDPILCPRVIWPSGISQSSLESRRPKLFCCTMRDIVVRFGPKPQTLDKQRAPTRGKTSTILFRSSDEDEDLRSRCGGHGDFWGTLTLVSEPGSEAGGVADRPAVEPERK